MDDLLSKLIKYEIKLRYLEGWITTVELTTRDDGQAYAKFSIPLKVQKDDEPDWLNCYVYGTRFADQFSRECKKGSKVGLFGFLKLVESDDGKRYVNFIVKSYTLFDDPKPKEA